VAEAMLEVVLRGVNQSIYKRLNEL